MLKRNTARPTTCCVNTSSNVLYSTGECQGSAEYWLWLDLEIDCDLSNFSQWGQRISDEGPSRFVGKIPISIRVIAAADELMSVDQSPRADILACYQVM